MRRDVPRASPAFVNPPRNLAGVGARLDAQLRREHPPVFIEVAFMEPDFRPGELRQQITAPGGQFGKLGDGGGSASSGQAASHASMPGRSPGDACRQYPVVLLSTVHGSMLEQVFQRIREVRTGLLVEVTAGVVMANDGFFVAECVAHANSAGLAETCCGQLSDGRGQPAGLKIPATHWSSGARQRYRAGAANWFVRA